MPHGVANHLSKGRAQRWTRAPALAFLGGCPEMNLNATFERLAQRRLEITKVPQHDRRARGPAEAREEVEQDVAWNSLSLGS